MTEETPQPTPEFEADVAAMLARRSRDIPELRGELPPASDGDVTELKLRSTGPMQASDSRYRWRILAAAAAIIAVVGGAVAIRSLGDDSPEGVEVDTAFASTPEPDPAQQGAQAEPPSPIEVLSDGTLRVFSNGEPFPATDLSNNAFQLLGREATQAEGFEPDDWPPGGRIAVTTPDQELQEAADRLVTEYSAKAGGVDTAIISVEPSTGAIKAASSTFDNADSRKLGSLDVPVILLAGFRQGFIQSDTISGIGPCSTRTVEGTFIDIENFGNSAGSSVAVLELCLSKPSCHRRHRYGPYPRPRLRILNVSGDRSGPRLVDRRRGFRCFPCRRRRGPRYPLHRSSYWK